MKTLTCDVCKQTMEEPVPNRTYFHICHRDLCEECKDNLEAVLKPVIRTQDPFSYEWYSKAVYDNIEKAIQKGKF
ncbi:MAG TPA: hypothetical protein DEQ14_02570 [Treponema sp.]|nr:hypothetical protein [Treponema sp.]